MAPPNNPNDPKIDGDHTAQQESRIGLKVARLSWLWHQGDRVDRPYLTSDQEGEFAKADIHDTYELSQIAISSTSGTEPRCFDVGDELPAENNPVWVWRCTQQSRLRFFGGAVENQITLYRIIIFFSS